MALADRDVIGRSAANDRRWKGAWDAPKSGDPSDQPLAAFERATPPSPLRAGAPAWSWPGRLRCPLTSPLRQALRLPPERLEFDTYDKQVLDSYKTSFRIADYK